MTDEELFKIVTPLVACTDQMKAFLVDNIEHLRDSGELLLAMSRITTYDTDRTSLLVKGLAVVGAGVVLQAYKDAREGRDDGE